MRADSDDEEKDIPAILGLGPPMILKPVQANNQLVPNKHTLPPLYSHFMGPAGTQAGGFISDLRLHDTIRYSDPVLQTEHLTIILCMITGFVPVIKVSADGENLIYGLTRTSMEPKELIDPESATDVDAILNDSEAHAIIKYFDGEEKEHFTITIPLQEKVFANVIHIRYSYKMVTEDGEHYVKIPHKVIVKLTVCPEGDEQSVRSDLA